MLDALNYLRFLSGVGVSTPTEVGGLAELTLKRCVGAINERLDARVLCLERLDPKSLV
jgi:hypothetical protein